VERFCKESDCPDIHFEKQQLPYFALFIRDIIIQALVSAIKDDGN
jgi:hypothetical protein